MNLPRTYPSPLEAIDQHLNVLREMSAKLLADNERLRKREIELLKELTMAQEARDAFRDQCRQKDALLDEMRALAKQPSRKQANQ